MGQFEVPYGATCVDLAGEEKRKGSLSGHPFTSLGCAGGVSTVIFICMPRDQTFPPIHNRSCWGEIRATMQSPVGNFVALCHARE